MRSIRRQRLVFMRPPYRILRRLYDSFSFVGESCRMVKELMAKKNICDNVQGVESFSTTTLRLLPPQGKNAFFHESTSGNEVLKPSD